MIWPYRTVRRPFSAYTCSTIHGTRRASSCFHHSLSSSSFHISAVGHNPGSGARVRVFGHSCVRRVESHDLAMVETTATSGRGWGTLLCVVKFAATTNPRFPKTYIANTPLLILIFDYGKIWRTGETTTF